jgi:putative DNA primase/helicase
MHDPKGKLVNLQFIYPDGSKFFVRGGRAKDCYSQIDGNLEPVVVVAEGFATAASINEATDCFVAVAFSANNLTSVAKLARESLNDIDASLWKAHKKMASEEGLEHAQRERIYNAELVIAADDDWKTKDNPGLMAAISAGRAARASIAAPTFERREDGDTDFNDLACRQGKGAVAEAIASAVEPEALLERILRAAPHFAHSSPVRGELAALRQTNVVRYEELLATLKKKGVRTAELDRGVKAAAKAAATARETHKEGDLFPHWAVEPWPEPIDTGALLNELSDHISSYVATLEKRAIVPALWTMFTYIHDVATHSPLLLVTSPEPNSGKSTMLGVLQFLVRRALMSVSISGPALFRSIEKFGPTIMLDEADTALVRNEDLKEVVNSGWTRGQGVIRCDPETHDPRAYSTFAPKAIGMKGKKLPDTTLSRAIIIEMKRKQTDERVRDFNHLDNPEFERLRRKLVRWAADNAEKLKDARPQLPDGFHNRTRANWALLFAIAELAGNELAEQLGEAARVIERAKDKTDGGALGIQLLTDIRKLFESENEDLLGSSKMVLSSREIVEKLKEDEEAPWFTFAKGKPITQRQLANLLRPFGITSGTVYPNPGSNDHYKGYKRLQFEEAWTRYLGAEDQESNGTSDRSGCRVNPTTAGEICRSRSGSDPGDTWMKDDELSARNEPSPATRLKKGVRSHKKRGFKFDLSERQARAAMEEEEPWPRED